MSYGFLYDMKPVKEVEPGWFKLRWKPIKHTYPHGGTWNLYTSRLFRGHHAIGIICRRSGEHNGWGRSWEDFSITVTLWSTLIEFWIRWRFHIMEEGPSDVAKGTRRPLNVAHLKETS